MGKNPLILTFDCGTQSVRALLFDKKGNLLFKEQIAYEPYESPEPGWAEREPDFYWEKLGEASRRLKKKAGDVFSDIIAVTLTTMRDTGVNLDADLRVLRPSILWVDERSVQCRAPMPAINRVLFALVGMLDAATANRANTKSNWIRENQPEIWEKTEKYVLLSCYLTYKFTGNLVDSVASQVGHIPFDYRHKRWMKTSQLKFPVFNVEPEKLPELVEPGECLGKITSEAAAWTGIPAGLPLIASGSDKGCETLGSGCVDAAVASLSFGTTSTVQLTIPKYVEPQQYLPAYPAVMPGMYNPEIEIYRGYWMISWFKNEFAEEERRTAQEEGISVEEVLNRRLLEVPPGSHGLMLQPYWGPGIKNPEARGAIVGFSDVHTKAHLYRAIVEGLNYALREGLETLCRRAKCQVDYLTVSGGGAVNNLICQITADMFGKTIKRAQTHETAGLGSSIAGFVGMGEFSSFPEAVGEMVRHTSVFQPTLEGFQIYDELYREVYRGIYPKMRPLYQKIREIYRKYGK